MSIPLGPFELRDRFAKGGMGEVWRALHVEQGVEVAVKVMTRAVDEDTMREFRREVRAAAGLDHPNIVVVLDTGRVEPRSAELSEGRLAAGAPWMAMELVEGGPINPLIGRLDWRGLKSTLLALLDALAHAHARGVIHRDLKPSNVLMGPNRSAVKLTDFGIAHIFGEGEETEARGTPSYMSPEQIASWWRDFGPWTDLYALGAVTFQLVTGVNPFRRRTWLETVNAHVNEPPPRFEPRHPMPAGLEDWILRMLEKNPRHRFQRAADAAWALMQLGEAIDKPRPGPVAVSGDAPTVQLSAPTIAPVVHGRTTLLWNDGRSLSERIDTSEVENAGSVMVGGYGSVAAPPIPSDWRRPQRRRSTRLAGVGLGLYGLRSVPVVGRETERDALWTALREANDGRPTAVILRGPVGSGKSRLAEWFGRRAHELGVAHVLTALHSPIASPADGIGAMMGRHLRCTGLSRDDVMQRIAPMLDGPEDVELVTELIRPTTDEERAAGVRAPRLRPVQRWAVARRLLARLCVERAALLWLDDVQWGADAVDFCESVLREAELPVVFVLTARDEELGGMGSRLESLAQRDDVHAVPIGPLDAPSRRALLRELLGLQPNLAAEVDRRSAGNPLFAVQLVGDWVQRGILVATPRGFEVREGAQVALPDGLHEVWVDRIERLARSVPGDALRALEVAACLGQEVSQAEWSSAARHAGVAIPDDLVDALLNERLAIPVADSQDWAFVHGMLRESLLRGAAEAGRAQRTHRACAAMLDARAGPQVAARLGRHLVEAGDWEGALEWLHVGARACIKLSEFREASTLLALRLVALREAGVPPEDPRWGDTWRWMAKLYRVQGHYDEARVWIRRVLDSPEHPGWESPRTGVRWELAWLAMKQDMADGVVKLREMIPQVEAIGDLPLLVRTYVMIAISSQYCGDMDGADEAIEQATKTAAHIERDVAVGEAHRVRAAVALQHGRLDEAQHHFQVSLDELTDLGLPQGRALALMGLGDVARFRGQLDEAEENYRGALAVLEACGAAGTAGIRASLAAIYIQRGDYREARILSNQAAEWFDHHASPVEATVIAWMGLPALAGLEDWEAWDALFAGPRPSVDADVAKAAELAGDLAYDRGQVVRARAAWRIAARQFKKLGQVEREAEVRSRLSG